VSEAVDGVRDTDRNPLLRDSGLPRFDEIEPRHVVPGMREILESAGSELDALESRLQDASPDAPPSWADLIDPLERLGDRLSQSWGIVSHLMGVRNSDELRKAYEEMQPAVIEVGLRQGQSAAIYAGLLAMRQGEAWSELDAAQQRIVENLIRDARHAGVGLEGAERERFNEIQRELAELATQFSNHVLDSTKAFSLRLTDPLDVEGLPDSWKQLASQAVREEGDEATPEAGPWKLTLDYPSFGPLMEHCRNRALREQIYRAYITRASSGDFDNAPLLEELRSVSIDAAKNDLDELAAHARQSGAPEADELRQWDLAFWSERLRESRFDYSEEELRPYFPLPKVLEGLFALAEELFGVRIRAADGEAPVWCDDVRFFRVEGSDGEEIAAFYLDPYSRPAEKRGGAWMDECLGRSEALAPAGEVVRRPVAYLVCNQTPPVGERPALMGFDEVVTLFHEFGHGLQHMLSEVGYGLASGIRNIEWDAVELPSQFMENWCYEKSTLDRISAHVDTGESLPDALYEKLKLARTFRAGSDMLRQLYFALTDLALHAGHAKDPTSRESAFEVQRRIASRTTVLEPLPEDRFLCSFGHIFAGGYAAGYYSYKWAEVLSADAFGAFEEAGLDDVEAVRGAGRRFRSTVLALGGSEHPMQVFERFRGRKPDTRALLRHSGLVEGA
jgi:oligopeptidase A